MKFLIRFIFSLFLVGIISCAEEIIILHKVMTFKSGKGEIKGTLYGLHEMEIDHPIDLKSALHELVDDHPIELRLLAKVKEVNESKGEMVLYADSITTFIAHSKGTFPLIKSMEGNYIILESVLRKIESKNGWGVIQPYDVSFSSMVIWDQF